MNKNFKSGMTLLEVINSFGLEVNTFAWGEKIKNEKVLFLSNVWRETKNKKVYGETFAWKLNGYRFYKKLLSTGVKYKVVKHHKGKDICVFLKIENKLSFYMNPVFEILVEIIDTAIINSLKK